MRSFIPVVVLAACVAAMPQLPTLPLSPQATNNMPVGVAQDICGSNTTLQCCNEVDTSTISESDRAKVKATTNIFSGIGGLLGKEGISLFDQCSKLSVTGLIGVDDILGNHCRNKVACCSGDQTVSGGLLNLGLPCVALGSIIA